MTADSIVLWLSAGKPIAATAILQLVERGKLALDDPVVRHVPEFAQHGKAAITIRQLLTHTGGFRWAPVEGTEPWDEIIARMAAARPEPGWTPGAKAGYHAYTSWFVLAEIIRRVDGRTFSDYVRQQIFLPLAMVDSWIGMPPEVYAAYGPRMAVMVHTDKLPPYPHRFASAAGAALCIPGANAHGPMHDLGHFYRMLLGGGELDGTRVLTADSVRAMSTAQRVGMFDETFKHVIDWGLGLIVDSKKYGADTVPYGFGPYSSPRTFGHGGIQSSVGMADPDRELVVCASFNGMPGEAKHDIRLRRFLAAVYEDLGLTE